MAELLLTGDQSLLSKDGDVLYVQIVNNNMTCGKL